MRFLVRKRRTTPAVIIVALIDVLIVLVIFLLVTTTFKQQSALKLQAARIVAGQKDRRERKPAVRREHRHQRRLFRLKRTIAAGDLRAIAAAN